MLIKSKQILHMALEIEQKGIEFYDRLKELFVQGTKSYVTLVMLRNDEVSHKEKYKILAKRIQSERKEVFNFTQKELEEITILINNKIFDEMENAVRFFGADPDISLILLYAIGVEYDTFYFYNKMVEKVIPAEKDLIKEILREEKGHIEKLMFLRTQLKFDAKKDLETEQNVGEEKKVK